MSGTDTTVLWRLLTHRHKGAHAAILPGGERRIIAQDIRLPLRSQPSLTPDSTAVLYTSSAPCHHGCHASPFRLGRTARSATRPRGCYALLRRGAVRWREAEETLSE